MDQMKLLIVEGVALYLLTCSLVTTAETDTTSTDTEEHTLKDIVRTSKFERLITLVKKSLGYRKKCIPRKVEVCHSFSYEDENKRFCFYFMNKRCVSVDKK